MSLEERVKYAAMKARHKNIIKPWYKKWWGWLAILAMAAFLVYFFVAAAYLYRQIQLAVQEKEQGSAQAVSQYLIEGPKTYYTGTSTPKVTIIEFSDFACPYCKYSSEAIQNIMNIYGDSVAIVYRDLPLHENSITLSVAARCAGRQGKFWPMYYLLFDNQDNLSASSDLNSSLKELGGSLGLDADRFNQCFNNNDPIKEIQRDYQDAQSLQLAGTPSWFFNNHQITGYLNEERLSAAIESLLAEK